MICPIGIGVRLVSGQEERDVSEYCFDYCFPGDEFGLTILCGRERLAGMLKIWNLKFENLNF